MASVALFLLRYIIYYLDHLGATEATKIAKF